MGSNPVLRMRIEKAVKLSRTIKADSLTELKRQCGLDAVSKTQFGRALRSLHANPGPVHVNRPHPPTLYMQGRPYHVTYVPVTPGIMAGFDQLTTAEQAEIRGYAGFISDVFHKQNVALVEYIDYTFDDPVVGRVSDIARAFGLSPQEDNIPLQRAVEYLGVTGQFQVDRRLLQAAIPGRTVYAAQERVALYPH